MYELVSPVHVNAVLKHLGQVLMAFGCVLAVPVLAALFFGQIYSAAIYGITASVLIIAGLTLNTLLPGYEIQLKEAVVIAALVFPLTSLAVSLPMSLSSDMPFIDAFFESVSALTTTGLSVAPEDVTPLFLFIRSWLQWIGGIGIIVLVLSVLLGPGTTAFRLYTVNFGQTKIRPGVISTAHQLAKIYIGITLIAFLILLVSGMSIFDALCHALSSVSTGGFSTRSDSIGGFEGILLPLGVSISCIMGALSFTLYPEILKHPMTLIKDQQVRYFILIASLGIVVFSFTLSEWRHIPDAAFQVVSALSTAGFSTMDISSLSDASKGVLSGLMLIGGSMGSTAGGIKIFRILVLIKLVKLVFLRLFLPRETITNLKIQDHVIEHDELNQITVFVLLYAIILIVSVFIFMIFGWGTGDAVFEVSSALGTVGLSSGVTGAGMPAILKLVLCADMLLGRIEIIPLFILAMPGTWINR